MKISRSIKIEVSPEQLFDTLQNDSIRLNWDKFLRKAMVLNAELPGKGVETYCESWFRYGLHTKYVNYNRPNVVAMKLASSSPLFRKFAGSWILKEGDGFTELDFVYAFETNRWLKWSPRLVGAFLKFEMGRRLLSLKKYCETKNPPPRARD